MLTAGKMMQLAARPLVPSAVLARGRLSAWFNTAGDSSRKDEDHAAEGQDASAGGLTPGAYAGVTAGTDEVSGPGPHKEAGQAEGGTSGGIAGAWRGMTSSFSVGADDMAGGSSAGTVTEDTAMKVDPEGELPPGPGEMTGAAAEARAGGFGQQRDPQAQQDKDAPEDLAQRARDISPGAQEAS